MNNRRGFTLIEIVLVLAIAGLIMVAVFSAISGAQKARRDHQRKNDLLQMVAAIDTWRANHMNDNLDSQADLDTLASGYMSNRRDPGSGQPYVMRYHNQDTPHDAVSAPPVGQIEYVVSHICGNQTWGSTPVYVVDAPGFTHGIRQFAVLLKLETGEVYCLDHR